MLGLASHRGMQGIGVRTCAPQLRVQTKSVRTVPTTREAMARAPMLEAVRPHAETQDSHTAQRPSQAARRTDRARQPVNESMDRSPLPARVQIHSARTEPPDGRGWQERRTLESLTPLKKPKLIRSTRIPAQRGG